MDVLLHFPNEHRHSFVYDLTILGLHKHLTNVAWLNFCRYMHDFWVICRPQQASAVPRGLRFGKPVVVFLCFTRYCHLQKAEQLSDLLPRLTRCETPKRGASGCGPTLVVSSDYFERAAVSRNLGAQRGFCANGRRMRDYGA